MKLLFVGDPHNQVRTPQNRKDDFHETFRKKVEEIKEIAIEEEVSAVLQAGDFFHTPQYNNDFIMDVVELWSFVPEKYQLLEELSEGKGDPIKIADRLREDIPLIGPIGNHDLIGESLKSYPRTSLAFLEKLGFMKVPSKDEPFMLTTEDGQKVAITATNYHHGMDKPEHVDDYIVDEKKGDIHIHMVHGYLAEKSLGDLIPHTLVDAAKDTKADLTLAGHDHIGFSEVEIDGKKFINPGSLTRTKADVKEIARMPKVVIITIENGEVTLEERVLKSARPGEDILDRTSIMKKNQQKAQIESIKSIVNKANLSKGQSVTDIIESVGDAENIDEGITSDVTSRVTDKMEVMGGSEVANTGDYYISQIVLENFQSHEHSVFDVSENLNIFTGESSNGKSSVMRGMRWLMDNHGRSQRESFIRHGAEYAKVTAVFSNGMTVSRVINEKAHRDNGWSIYDPSTGETEKGNTRMVDQIRALFGYTKVQFDTDEDLDINFLNQGDGWYFIGDQMTASKRAKVIGAIFGTHYTDAVMRDLEREIRQNRQEVEIRTKDLDKTTEQINDYDYLVEFEEDLKKAAGKIDELQIISERKEKLEQLIDGVIKLKEQEKQINKVLEETMHLDKANSKLNQLEEIAERYHTVTGLLVDRTNIIKNGRTSRALVKELANVDNANTKLDQLTKLTERHTKLTESINQLVELTNQKKKLSILINQHEEQANKKRSEYSDLLDEHGVCPTCGQTVDECTLTELLHSDATV